MNEKEKLIYIIMQQDSTIKLYDRALKFRESQLAYVSTQLDVCVDAHEANTDTYFYFGLGFLVLVFGIVVALTNLDRIYHFINRTTNDR